MRTGTVISVLFFLAFWPVCGRGASPLQVPSIDAPYAKEAPRLDASETDAAWSNAAEIPDLAPSPGTKAGLPFRKTTVRLLWDKKFLYVRFVCEGDDILATLTGRDAEYSREDAAEVFLDPVGDEKEYIELQVSPHNGVRDVLYLCTGVPASGEDRTQPAELIARDIWTFPEWTLDGLKTAAGRFESGGRRGWIVELAIPANCLRRLGRKEFGPMTLRANFIRLDHPADPARPGVRNFVSSAWSPVVAGRAHRSPAANGYVRLTAP